MREKGDGICHGLLSGRAGSDSIAGAVPLAKSDKTSLIPGKTMPYAQNASSGFALRTYRDPQSHSTALAQRGPDEAPERLRAKARRGWNRFCDIPLFSSAVIYDTHPKGLSVITDWTRLLNVATSSIGSVRVRTALLTFALSTKSAIRYSHPRAPLG